jgi:hypothetical protein
MTPAELNALAEPSEAMVNAFVALALETKIGGSFLWPADARQQWGVMLAEARKEMLDDDRPMQPMD